MHKNNIDVSIIIVSFNTKEILKGCIESLLKNLGNIKYEIIIVDNNSSDGSVDYLKKIAADKNFKCVFSKENLGFGGGNNIGMKMSKGNYILLLNSDCIIKNDVIKRVKDWMDNNKDYGLASPNLYNPDGSVQGTGGYFPTIIRVFSWMTIQDLPLVDDIIKPFHPMKNRSIFRGSGFYNEEKDLDWVTGAFFMLRRKAYEDTGLFDRDFFMYTEEVDYSFRLRQKGWLVKYLPLEGVIHIGGASSGFGNSILREFEGVKIFYKKHYSKWKYPVLRYLLKIGCLWRIVVFGLIKGKEAGKIYAKALATI